MAADLILHCGARIVDWDELADAPVPRATATWFPVGHTSVLESVHASLADAGYVVRRERLALSGNQHQFFGVLDLELPLTDGVSLAVGVRNSTDKTFPMGFIAGQRVFICDNLAFHSELLVRRRHTRFGEESFGDRIRDAIGGLEQYRAAEQGRIEMLRGRDLGDHEADHLILRGYEHGVIPARALPGVIQAWRTPPQADFEPRTAWSLFNAVTWALKDGADTAPQGYAVRTMKLYGLLLPESGGDGPVN